MDKLTAIKIKYDDGTYSDEIPVSVLSENVEWDSTHTLVDILGSIDVDVTGTIQDQISQLFNEKVSASELNNYVVNQLKTDVTDWLSTNVDPVGAAVVIDKTFSMSGAAADALLTNSREFYPFNLADSKNNNLLRVGDIEAGFIQYLKIYNAIPGQIYGVGNVFCNHASLHSRNFYIYRINADGSRGTAIMNFSANNDDTSDPTNIDIILDRGPSAEKVDIVIDWSKCHHNNYQTTLILSGDCLDYNSKTSTAEIEEVINQIQNDMNEIETTTNEIQKNVQHISIKQLQLDYYPLDMLPQVTVYRNKYCGGFNRTTKLPNEFYDTPLNEDIYVFNLQDLINEGVTQIITYDQTDLAQGHQREIVWTEGVWANNIMGTVEDGIRTIILDNIKKGTWLLMAFTRENAWMKFVKDYSEDTIERGVKGWVTKEDLQPNAFDDMSISSQNIRTEIETFESTSDKLGEVIPQGQIMETNPITYNVSTNATMLLSILPIAQLKEIQFKLLSATQQWGTVIKLANVLGNMISGTRITLKAIENNELSWVSFNSETRIATVNIEEVKELYPEAVTIWVDSARAAGNPVIKMTNQKYLTDFKWLLGVEEDNSAADLLLPSKVPVVVNMPLYCYFENMLPKGFLKDFTVTTENITKTRREVFKYIPTSIGNVLKTVTVFDKEKPINSQNFYIQAVAKESSEIKTINVLCIGDSKTEAAGKRVRVNALVADDPYLNLTFIGTHGSAPTLSEGYSGRNIIEVCRSATLGSFTNIFYDSSITEDNKFNFAQGVATIGSVPDIVFIDHGANQYNQNWDTVKGCYNSIINSIKNYNANIKIVICMQECSALATKTDYTQGNKYGYGYGNASTNYSLPKMLAEFDNREDENIFICPQYLCLDLYRDFPLALLPTAESSGLKEYFCLDLVHPGTNIGNWSSTTKYPIYSYIRKNGKPYAAVSESTNIDPETDDGTHWTPIVNPEAGYNKIGDMYYYVIKYILSLEE